MRFFLYIISSFVILTSCSQHVEGYDKPDDLIPKDRMILVMTEMVKLETHIKDTYTRVDRFYNVMNASGDSLLKGMGVTPEAFDSSMKYYASHQKEMEEIYSEVLENLNIELGELQENKD